MVVGLNPLPIYLDVRNSGKTTAIINELNAAITHELPDQPPHFKLNNFAIPPVVAGGTTRTFMQFETGWGEETTNAVTSGTQKLFIFGVIKYEDVFSFFDVMETGFCFIYVPTAAVFRNCLAIPYTYTK